jgi:hypothetical protein
MGGLDQKIPFPQFREWMRLVSMFMIPPFRKDPELLHVAAVCGMYCVFHG